MANVDGLMAPADADGGPLGTPPAPPSDGCKSLAKLLPALNGLEGSMRADWLKILLPDPELNDIPMLLVPAAPVAPPKMSMALGSVFNGDGCAFLELPELGPDGTVKEEGLRGVLVAVAGGFMPKDGVVIDWAPADTVVVVVDVLAAALPLFAADTPFGRIRRVLESVAVPCRMVTKDCSSLLTGFEGDSVSGRLAFFFIGFEEVPRQQSLRREENKNEGFLSVNGFAGKIFENLTPCRIQCERVLSAIDHHLIRKRVDAMLLYLPLPRHIFRVSQTIYD